MNKIVLDCKKPWKKPELTTISNIETSENVLEWTSGPPERTTHQDNETFSG